MPLDVVVGGESAQAIKNTIGERTMRQTSAPEMVFAYFNAIAKDLIEKGR